MKPHFSTLILFAVVHHFPSENSFAQLISGHVKHIYVERATMRRQEKVTLMSQIGKEICLQFGVILIKI